MSNYKIVGILDQGETEQRLRAITLAMEFADWEMWQSGDDYYLVRDNVAMRVLASDFALLQDRDVIAREPIIVT